MRYCRCRTANQLKTPRQMYSVCRRHMVRCADDVDMMMIWSSWVVTHWRATHIQMHLNGHNSAMHRAVWPRLANCLMAVKYSLKMSEFKFFIQTSCSDSAQINNDQSKIIQRIGNEIYMCVLFWQLIQTNLIRTNLRNVFIALTHHHSIAYVLMNDPHFA